MESQKKVNWKVHLTKIPKFLRVPDWGWLLLEFAFLQRIFTGDKNPFVELAKPSQNLFVKYAETSLYGLYLNDIRKFSHTLIMWWDASRFCVPHIFMCVSGVSLIFFLIFLMGYTMGQQIWTHTQNRYGYILYHNLCSVSWNLRYYEYLQFLLNFFSYLQIKNIAENQKPSQQGSVLVKNVWRGFEMCRYGVIEVW
jgi:hypothetical protein